MLTARKQECSARLRCTRLTIKRFSCLRISVTVSLRLSGAQKFTSLSHTNILLSKQICYSTKTGIIFPESPCLTEVLVNNVFAYTALGSNYPEYLSVNANEDSTVEITVRSPKKTDG